MLRTASFLACGLLNVLVSPACLTFKNQSRPVRQTSLTSSEGWILVQRVPFVRQGAPAQCGYAVAAMVNSYWGTPTTLVDAKKAMEESGESGVEQEGLKAGALRSYFRLRSFDAFLVSGEITDLIHELKNNRPIIVGTMYREGNDFIAHYEVVVAINPHTREVVTLDPRYGRRLSRVEHFLANWTLANRLMLVLSPAGQTRNS